MVLVLDGSSEKVRTWRDLTDLIWFRHLFESRAITNLIFFWSENTHLFLSLGKVLSFLPDYYRLGSL